MSDEKIGDAAQLRLFWPNNLEDIVSGKLQFGEEAPTNAVLKAMPCANRCVRIWRRAFLCRYAVHHVKRKASTMVLASIFGEID